MIGRDLPGFRPGNNKAGTTPAGERVFLEARVG
jgi:hypothetical protein